MSSVERPVPAEDVHVTAERRRAARALLRSPLLHADGPGPTTALVRRHRAELERTFADGSRLPARRRARSRAAVQDRARPRRHPSAAAAQRPRVHPAWLRPALPHHRRAEPGQEPAARRRTGGAGALSRGRRRAGRRPRCHRRSARALRGAVRSGRSGRAPRARRRSRALGRPAHRVPARRPPGSAGVARRCAAGGVAAPPELLESPRCRPRPGAPASRCGAGSWRRLCCRSTSSPRSRRSGGDAAATASANGSPIGSASTWSSAPRAPSRSTRRGAQPISSSPAEDRPASSRCCWWRGPGRGAAPGGAGRAPRANGCGGRAASGVVAADYAEVLAEWGRGAEEGLPRGPGHARSPRPARCWCQAGCSGSRPTGAWLVHAGSGPLHRSRVHRRGRRRRAGLALRGACRPHLQPRSTTS